MEGNCSSKKLTWLFFGAALFLAFGFRATAVQAASLYLSPSSAEYNVGRTFFLTVGVSSASQAVNAISASISFSTDKLEVTEVSKSGTVMGLWVKEPSFSNASGMVNFEGIILNPGFTGNAGKLVVIGFKTKAAGTATVTVSSGSILANDGLGTNITSGLGKFTATIKGEAAGTTPTPTPPPVTPPVSGVPQSPTVQSSTHPDSNAWYGQNTADLQWSLVKGVTAVSVFVDQRPETTPSPTADGLFDSYSTKPLADGVWYFHIRVKNAAGWSPAGHYRMQIDTAPPENLQIKFVNGNETTDPQPKVEFLSTDLSGIDHYEVKAGDGETLKVTAKDLIGNYYILPVQQPGTRRLLVTAVDRAGNHALSSADYTILALDAPTIVQYPARLRAGETLVVRGATGYPDMSVVVWLQNGNGPTSVSTVKTDTKGDFVYLAEGKVVEGIYKLWAQISDGKGGISRPSDKVSVVVEKVAWLMIAGRAVNVWPFVLLVPVLLAAHLLFLWRIKKRLAAAKVKKTVGIKERINSIKFFGKR